MASAAETRREGSDVKKIHSRILHNAAEMARAHPETFDYAPKQVLDSIRPGNQVKICDGSERFWVRVTKRDLGGLFVGKIENCLLADKPYGFGDRIRFGVENVYDFSPGTDEEPHEPEQQFFEGFE